MSYSFSLVELLVNLLGRQENWLTRKLAWLIKYMHQKINQNEVKILEYFQQFEQPICKTRLPTKRVLSNVFAHVASINTLRNF